MDYGHSDPDVYDIEGSQSDGEEYTDWKLPKGEDYNDGPQPADSDSANECLNTVLLIGSAFVKLNRSSIQVVFLVVTQCDKKPSGNITQQAIYIPVAIHSDT